MATHTFLQENFLMKGKPQVHSLVNSSKSTLKMKRLCQFFLKELQVAWPMWLSIEVRYPIKPRLPA